MAASEPRARLSQDRSRQRRELLLDAALALFAEQGQAGITHRAVARRAGVPLATTAYYFGSIEALIEEALARHIERWVADLRKLTAGPVPANPTGGDAVEMVAAVFGVRTLDVVHLHLAVYLAATRSPTLRPRAAQALADLEALVVRILGHFGVPDAAGTARAMVASVAGSAVGRLSERTDDREEAAALVRALTAHLVLALVDEKFVADTLRKLRHEPN